MVKQIFTHKIALLLLLCLLHQSGNLSGIPFAIRCFNFGNGSGYPYISLFHSLFLHVAQVNLQ